MKKKSSSTKHTRAGLKILAGLQEIVEALESGEPLDRRFTIREVVVPEPRRYDAKAVKNVRQRLGVSQSLFAHLVGVSVILEQAWEQGRRVPNTTARRLLDEIHRDPSRWASMLQPAKAA